MTLQNWTGAPQPTRSILAGRYCRLEPLDLSRHGDELWRLASTPEMKERYRYLFIPPPRDRAEFTRWATKATTSDDPLYFVVVSLATGRAEGWQSLMRIDPAHGVIEIGGVMWGPAIARTRVATEAQFLFANYVFSQGYRRYEWKCDNRNTPSKRAAERFGFQYEGLFRQHMVIKGENRDTAWFAILDRDWPRLKRGYEAWLAPENFDERGRQRSKLRFADASS